MKRFSAYALAVLLLFTAGCDKEYSAPTEGGKVQVELRLSAAEPEVHAEPGSRAAQPMIPSDENPIYNIWILQFDSEGIIIDRPRYYNRHEEGELSTVLTPTLRADDQCTVCAVANLGKDFRFEVDGREVDNITTFRAMLVDAPLVAQADPGKDNVGHLHDRSMYLYGYYQGGIQKGQRLTVMLGRLFLRINLILDNRTGAPLDDIAVRIDNVPSQTRIPFVDIPADESSFIAYEERIAGTLANGSTASRYYYMPENISPDRGHATRVTITAGGQSASVELGNDAPSIPEGLRDYSLNRNNIYTFRLNLK